MWTILSFIVVSLALSDHVDGRAMKPREISAATSSPPSTAVTNVTCHGKAAYNYSGMTSVPANSSCTTQTYYVNTKSPNCTTKTDYIYTLLYLLYRRFFEFYFVNYAMLDVFLHQLLTILFDEHSMLNFFIFKHSMLNFFLIDRSMLDFLLLVDYFMFNFLLFKPMPINIAEAKLKPMLLLHEVHRIAYQTSYNHLPNSTDQPLDNCDLHSKRSNLVHLYIYYTSTWIYVTSTGSGPLSSAIQSTSPAGAIQTTASGGSPSSVPFAPTAVPSATNSISSPQPSTSTVGITITVSKAGSEITQTVASATNVIEGSSSIIPVPPASAQTGVTGVQSAGTASRNMDVPSVGTANAVAPSAPSDMASPSVPMETQSTVTIPVIKTTTICPSCDLTAGQPSMSVASSPEAPISPASPMSSPQAPAPPASNDMSPSAPANAPSSPATMAASTGMSSPASSDSMGASSAPAQMSSPSAVAASEQPPSPTV
ncbi:hypothetical protein KCU73_g1582, partial [Aureobasidium melanogenum]